MMTIGEVGDSILIKPHGYNCISDNDNGFTTDIKGVVGVSSHTFRYFFAKTYLMNGGDVFTLQKLLGHSSMEMTRIYAQMGTMDVKEQHEKFTPMNRLLDVM